MPKVLIVSEADLAPALGGTILWGRDVERVFASSPAAALDVARAYVPSLVVVNDTDEADTLRFLRQLREHAGTRRSSIVVVTGSPGSSPGDEALQGGANLVLRLPVEPSAWDARLARLLAVPTRLRIHFPVQVRRQDAPGEAFTAHALDLSVTGMLLESDTAVPSGEALELGFRLPGSDEELHATARVVRSSRGAPASLGLSFRGLEGPALECIRGLLASVPVVRAFGRYEALGPLGEGSMGCVYRAFDPVAQRVVAIKTLRPELLGTPQAHDYAQRFRREAQAAAKLGHPNIVTIFDVGEDYFVMELLEGRTLQQLLRECGRLEPAAACAILGPVARALDYAHSQGAIHRDVKPANIMIAPDGRPTVMDFGVVHLVSGSITATGQVFGSPFYMAPEQINQSGASPQTDIFSLGVIAYEALTARKPFEGVGITPILYHVVHTDPPAASSLNGDLAPHHDRALQRALAKDPAHRYSTATSFVEALSGAVDGAQPVQLLIPILEAGLSVADPADPRVETQDLGTAARALQGGRSRRRAGIAASVVVIAAIATALGLWMGPRPDAEVRGTTPGLSITTTPPGATIWLDGEEVGTSPLFLTHVPPASHSVRAAAKGYVPTELTVRTTEEATPMPIRLILQAATGTLEIDSDPAAAKVQVDGEDKGTTPFSDSSIAPGTHRVLVELGGYRPFSQTADVTAGETERLVAHLERSSDVHSAAGDLRQKGWVRVGDLVALGPGVKPPWRVSGNPAPFPDEARRLGIEGTVAVALTVSEKGDVVEARVVESAGDVLDQAMLAASRTWRYEPAESNGVKVRVRIVERQGFALPR